mmetsp:Transcript_14373/g.27727  ORF Transcript_14373/g.27727 Transcript_14373/m.27727 type:complete len:723 (-) Transcript_14373:79-2247(-)
MLLNLLLQVVHVDISLIVSLAGHDLHTRHHSTCWVGTMSGDWNDANVPVVVAIVVVVGSNRHQTSILSRGSTVWLHGHGIESSDFTEHIGKVRDHLLVTDCLILGSIWMHVSELWHSDWHHLRRGVQLHCAGAQRNHRVAQGEVLCLQSRQISEHLVLRVVGVENIVSEEVGCSLEHSNVAVNLFGERLGGEGSRPTRENGEKQINVFQGGGFVKGNRDVAGIQHANVVALLNSSCDNTSGIADVDRNGIEEEVGGDAHSELLGTGSHDSGETVNSGGNFLQSFWSMIDGIHRCNVGKEGLGSADVGSRLLPSDVLLTRLHSHTERRVSVLINTRSNDTARHDSLVLVSGSKKGSVWTTISHWNSESLRRSDGNVCPELSWRGEHGQGKQVGGHDDLGVHSVSLLDDSRVLVQGPVSRWILEKNTTHVLATEVEIILGSDNALESKAFGSRGTDGNGLRVALVRHKELRLLSIGHGAGHGHGFGSGGGLVQQGSVGKRETSQIGDHGLVVEQRLEPSLSDFGLVWGVLGVPARVLQQVSQDHSWGEGSVVSHPNEVLVHSVLASELLHVFQELVLSQRLVKLSQIQRLGLADMRWDGGVDKLLQRTKAGRLHHSILDTRGRVTHVSRNKAVAWLQAADRDASRGLKQGVVPRRSVALCQGNGACGDEVVLSSLGHGPRHHVGLVERFLSIAREQAHYSTSHAHLSSQEAFDSAAPTRLPERQ